MRLENKVAVITGAANGIGKHSAELFAAEGAAVVLVDMNKEKGSALCNSINQQGGRAHFVYADISKESDCNNMIAECERTFDKLSILFNNAGIMLNEDHDAITTSEATWDKTFDVNVKGVFFGCKYGIPALQRAGGGVIINTASFVALMGAATPQLAYTASKGAVLALTRELAILHAKENIRVTSLCPGPLQTELLMKFLDTNEKKNRRLNHIPMGRFGLAEEMAKAALFLASDDASYITGNPFIVDGGISSAYVTAE